MLLFPFFAANDDKTAVISMALQSAFATSSEHVDEVASESLDMLKYEATSLIYCRLTELRLEEYLSGNQHLGPWGMAAAAFQAKGACPGDKNTLASRGRRRGPLVHRA